MIAQCEVETPRDLNLLELGSTSSPMSMVAAFAKPSSSPENTDWTSLRQFLRYLLESDASSSILD
jgi:hypothetical protein